MLYLDMGAVAVAAYDLLMPLAQMQGQERVPQLDLAALPTADVLNRNLGGAITFGATAGLPKALGKLLHREIGRAAQHFHQVRGNARRVGRDVH